MYVRIDTDGNLWEGTARYKKVKTPNAVKKAMEKLNRFEAREAIEMYGKNIYIELNDLIKSFGGDVLATRRPDLINRSWVVKS